MEQRKQNKEQKNAQSIAIVHERHDSDVVAKKKELVDIVTQSTSDPAGFYSRHASEVLTWFAPFSKVYEGVFSEGESRWFSDGILNACFNAVDRHAQKTPEKTALIYDDGSECSSLTYSMLHREVCTYARYFSQCGLKKGDVVAVYLPMSQHAVVAALACARLGIVHNIVFSGYSAENLAHRIEDSGARLIVSTTTYVHRPKTVDCAAKIHDAVAVLNTVERVLFVDTLPALDIVDMHGRRVACDGPAALGRCAVGDDVPCVPMASNDALFYLYTSGSTNKPKGIVHSTAGYLAYAALTTRLVFDLKESDVFFCTADLAWITGHTYSMYGPLVLGATTVCYGGVPSFPDFTSIVDIIVRHRVTQLYTAPTLIRLLRKNLGDEYRPKDALTSIRVIGSVGEPIDEASVQWYHDVFGNEFSFFVDTYWQTESGGILKSQIPYLSAPGICRKTFPMPGIRFGIRTVDGKTGHLVVESPWPGCALTMVGGRTRFVETYLDKYKGAYFTGDEACMEEETIKIVGRADDVINVSGHRMSTREIENTVASVGGIADVACVGLSDELTGQCVMVVAVLRDGSACHATAELAIQHALRTKIGPIAKAKHIVFATDLPKTTTGKIMRRVIRSIAKKEKLGDVSTCANEEAIFSLAKLFASY